MREEALDLLEAALPERMANAKRFTFPSETMVVIEA
jgi:hypothetical protein